jgi:hypothetical protein
MGLIVGIVSLARQLTLSVVFLVVLNAHRLLCAISVAKTPMEDLPNYYLKQFFNHTAAFQQFWTWWFKTDVSGELITWCKNKVKQISDWWKSTDVSGELITWCKNKVKQISDWWKSLENGNINGDSASSNPISAHDHADSAAPPKEAYLDPLFLAIREYTLPIGEQKCSDAAKTGKNQILDKHLHTWASSGNPGDIQLTGSEEAQLKTHRGGGGYVPFFKTKSGELLWELKTLKSKTPKSAS